MLEAQRIIRREMAGSVIYFNRSVYCLWDVADKKISLVSTNNTYVLELSIYFQPLK